MLEEVLRSPRKVQESTDLHRWAMLRIAINEDKCCAMVAIPKKKKKKSKDPNSMSSLFKDLPSMTAVRTWKSKVGGDIRQRYGRPTEWASGLTDSAFLMYGIPRASLKQDHMIKLKQRHLRKKVTPRSINYSQSFSEYATPGQLEVSIQPRDRHSMAAQSIESSVSSMSSTPSTSSPGAPSPIPPRIPHLPPNSVSVLPRSNPKVVNLNHVDSANLDLYTSKAALDSADSKLVENRRNGTSSTPPESPNGEVVRNTLVTSILETNNKPEETNNNISNSTSSSGEEQNDNNINNNNKSDNNRSISPVNSTVSEAVQTMSISRIPKAPSIPEAPKLNGIPSAQNTLQRPVIIGQVNRNSNNNNNNNNIFAELSKPAPVVVCNPIPPAPKIPIHKRPPQPAPKPKHRPAKNHKFNMEPLQAALIGSLNKRFKAPKIED